VLPVQIDALPEKPYDDEYRMVKDRTLSDEDVLWLFDDGYATMMMTWLGYTTGSLARVNGCFRVRSIRTLISYRKATS
jgi:hypothetical protein